MDHVTFIIITIMRVCCIYLYVCIYEDGMMFQWLIRSDDESEWDDENYVKLFNPLNM